MAAIIALSTTYNAIAAPDRTPSEAVAWRFGVDVSVITQQLREETLHRLRNMGLALSPGLELGRYSRSSIHAFRFHLPLGVLVDRYGYTSVSIQYGLEGYGLWHVDPNLSLGYMAAANVRYRYFPEWDDSHLYWLTDYSLGPAMQYRFTQMPKLSLHMDFGLISLISRPPQYPLSKFDNILTLSGFFSVPQQHKQIRHIGNFQVGKILLSFDIGQPGRHKIQYESRLVRVDDPLLFVEAWHNFGWRYDF